VPSLHDETHLSASLEGRGGVSGGNLLHDREIIRRGGTKEGWLVQEGQKGVLGLNTGQTPVVEVSFQDVHNKVYRVISRQGFEKQMEDIRMGRYGSR
jgi:hypothetical protein